MEKIVTNDLIINKGAERSLYRHLSAVYFKLLENGEYYSENVLFKSDITVPFLPLFF